jgi:hypothetical protein
MMKGMVMEAMMAVRRAERSRVGESSRRDSREEGMREKLADSTSRLGFAGCVAVGVGGPVVSGGDGFSEMVVTTSDGVESVGKWADFGGATPSTVSK